VAANYSIETQRRTVQVLGPTDVLDVMEVGARTRPHGVFFQRSVPYAAWETDGADSFVEPVAASIEGRLGDDFIGGAIYTQDVDATGLLQDLIEFTVWLPENHAMTTVVPVQVDLLGGTDTFVQGIVAAQFQSALDALRFTAGL
jgi:hypothetical protein